MPGVSRMISKDMTHTEQGWMNMEIADRKYGCIKYSASTQNVWISSQYT